MTRGSLLRIALLGSALVGACGGDEPAPTWSEDGGDGVATDAVAALPAETLARVVAYQTVAIDLSHPSPSSDGAVPLVAGRKTLVRLFVEPADGDVVTARLTVHSGSVIGEYMATGSPAARSTDADLESTLNVELPPEALIPGAGLTISLEGPGGRELRWPTEGVADLRVVLAPPPLRVVVLPIHYVNERVPDTSEEQLTHLRELLLAMFPLVDLRLSVHPEPLDYASPIQPDGQGWGDALASVCVRRIQDDAPIDTIYFGMVSPASTLDEYCATGCTLGGALGVGIADEWSRCALGIGFSAPRTALVAAHELAHVLGRAHAPCGASGDLDPEYPNADGSTAVWGWDSRVGDLVAPSAYDLMTYCSPRWPSAYTYGALLGALDDWHSSGTPTAGGAEEWRLASVDPGGGATWRDTVTLRSPPLGTRRPVTLRGANQRVVDRVEGHYYPLEGGGGLLLAPASVAHVRTSVDATLAR